MSSPERAASPPAIEPGATTAAQIGRRPEPLAFLAAGGGRGASGRAQQSPRILTAGAAGIAEAAQVLRSSRLVAYPTETLYGLGADALDEAALVRVQRVKGRSPGHAFPLIVPDIEMVQSLVEHLPDLAVELMRRHWPGALTLILPARSGLPSAIVGERGGVGLRISSDPVVAALVAAFGRPLLATSANRSGAPAATTAAAACLEDVDIVLDGGRRQEQASTIVELLDRPRLLRQGAVRVDGVLLG